MNELKTGSVLQNGKYRIESVLGQGGFGITYLATQTMLGCKVAIKEFFFRDCCERTPGASTVSVTTEAKRDLVDKFRKKFLKEARLLLTINHHNIVRVMDAFEENATAYYAMEFIDGTSLSQLISLKGQLTPQETMAIVDPVCQALAYLHSRSINHLDIKPSNIMVENATGRVMLIDFGVSKQYDPETGQSTTTTPVGVSHGFAPLEQYNNDGVSEFSPQSDIYAVGATMLAMLTGTTPQNAVELSQQGGPAIPDTLPHNMAVAIRAAMQPVKAARPQTIQHFLDILRNGTADDEATTIVTDGGGSKRNVWIVVAVVLAVVAAVAFALFMHHGSVEPSVGGADTDTIATDSMVATEPEVPELATTHFSQAVQGKLEKTSLDLEYPTDGPELLVQNIREWINETLGGKYKGDLADGKALFDHYFNAMKTEMTDDPNFEVYTQSKIRKLYEDTKVVTFIFESYAYGEGGAHGMETTKGVTFRKSDGRKFTASLLDSSSNFQSMIKTGLKKYFDVTTDDALMEQLQLDEYANGVIPLPETDPWITAEGVTFCYQPYEIACYAAGMPTFTIPTSEVKERSAATTQSFFE